MKGTTTADRESARTTQPEDRREPAAGDGRPGRIGAVQRAVGNGALQRQVQAVAVSHPRDPAEREADRMADRVMAADVQREDGDAPADQPPRINRAPRQGTTTAGRAGPALHAQLESTTGGRPLGPSVRSFVEPRFGRDFGDVRVHTGGSAVALNRRLESKAFTHGRDVYFGAGQYSPGTTRGRALLAHELTHVVQQTGEGPTTAARARGDATTIQRNVFGDLYQDAAGVVEGAKQEAGEFVAGAEETYEQAKASIGGALGTVYDRAMNAVGMDPATLLSLLRSLDSSTIQWLATADQKIWDAISYLGSRGLRGLQELGRRELEKLAIIGENLWSFVVNLPFRLWRYVIHRWDGITGRIRWLSSGLARAGLHVGEGVLGAIDWIEAGADRLRAALANAVARGVPHAHQFVMNPTRENLNRTVMAILQVPPATIEGFRRWGIEGLLGAAHWVTGAFRGLGSWLYEGIAGGAAWAGNMLLYTMDVTGVTEAAQIIYGAIFRMRSLTPTETAASQQVHPPGTVPYDLVRVDEHSILTEFSEGRKFVSFHIIHLPGDSPSIPRMVHELTHVAQFDDVGSVYMPQALHAQDEWGSGIGVGSGTAYDFTRVGPLPAQRANGRTFQDLNREAQAELFAYYYNNCPARYGSSSGSGGGSASGSSGGSSGSSGGPTCADLDPWIRDVEQRGF